MDKDKTPDFSHLASPETPICHSCGQRTPQRSTFGSFSSSATTRTNHSASSSTTAASSLSAASCSWEKRRGEYQRSDSGYSSFTYSTDLEGLSPTATRSSSPDDHYSTSYSEKRASSTTSFTTATSSPEPTKVMAPPSRLPPMPPPKRQATYSSSVYSRYDDDDNDNDGDDDDDDDDHSTRTEAFPSLPVMMENDEYRDDMSFDLPPRTLSNYSSHFQPPAKSRYARLNDLPAASPRSAAFNFSEDSDADDDIEREGRETAEKGEGRRRRNFSKSLSVTVLPSQLRRLSLGKKDAPVHQDTM